MSPLPRLLWTACGRPELRKKLEPSCLPTTLAAVSRVALGPEREDRRQRKSGLKPARSDTIALPDLSRQRRSRRVKSCHESPPEQPAASDNIRYVSAAEALAECRRVSGYMT